MELEMTFVRLENKSKKDLWQKIGSKKYKERLRESFGEELEVNRRVGGLLIQKRVNGQNSYYKMKIVAQLLDLHLSQPPKSSDRGQNRTTHNSP